MQHVSHEGFLQMMANGDYVLKKLLKSKPELNFDIFLPPSFYFPTFHGLSFSGRSFATMFAMT
jgi:hypothetical protein